MSTSIKRLVLDTSIRVDRSIKPMYPDLTKRVIHPEFEFSGPELYSLKKNVEFLLFEKNSQRSEKGQTIYEYQKTQGMLETGLNLQDLIAIKESGAFVFHTFFSNNPLFGWKSVILHRWAFAAVPCLALDMQIRWFSLGNYMPHVVPVLKF